MTTHSNTHHCESCTMPIESGPYCSYCADEAGELKPFDDRFENMIGFAMRRDSALTREQAERQTLRFMGQQPAWKNHPDYLARLARGE